MSNTSTFMELASNGYVVCSMDHPYHAAGTIDTDGNLTIGSSKFVQGVIDIEKTETIMEMNILYMLRQLFRC